MWLVECLLLGHYYYYYWVAYPYIQSWHIVRPQTVPGNGPCLRQLPVHILRSLCSMIIFKVQGRPVVLFFLKRRFLILNKEQQHEKTIVNLTFRYDIPFVDHCILQFNPTMSSKEDKKAGQSQITWLGSCALCFVWWWMYRPSIPMFRVVLNV